MKDIRWNLWHALNNLHRSYARRESPSEEAQDFVKYIEIDEKFARMQFI